MNRKAIRSGWLGVLLTMLWVGLSPGQTASLRNETDRWEALVGERADGIEANRWQRMVEALKGLGFSVDSTRECLAPLQEAVRQALPLESVWTRIEEGVAKGVSAQALQDAVRQRLASLEQAAAILREAGYSGRNRRHDKLIKSLALAMESGISADSLRGILTRTEGGQYERIQSIVEAGEVMRLNGMDEATVTQMMNDFTERKMRRTEIIRAARFAMQQHSAHVEGTRIRQQLWDRSDSGGRWGRGENGTGFTRSDAGAGGPAERGNGSMGPGAPSGPMNPDVSPGHAPSTSGSEDGGPRGSTGPGANAPTEAGPGNAAPNSGR